MNKKHHCMVVHAYYPIGESRVEREAQALIEQGYEVDVICLRDAGEKPEEWIRDVHIYRLPIKRHRGRGPIIQFQEYLAFFVLAFFKLSRLYLRRKYQSVQVHNLPDFLVFSTLVPKLAGARIILDLHDLMPEFFASSFNSGMKSLPVRLLILQEKLACRFADHVITVTELWRQTLIRRGVNPQKVSVVMNVADNHIFYQNSVPVTGQTEKQNDAFHLFYHGTLTYRYGVDLLLLAVSKVAKQIPEIRLTIHGRGEFIDDLRKLAKYLEIEAQVAFSTTYLPISSMPMLIRSADVGVVPNRRDVFTDGILPTKLMEYVALGVPVLTADTPIIRQYFDDTMVQYFRAGDVDDLAKNILYLYHNQKRLKELAQNANQFNQEYDWNRVAAGYTSTLDQLIGKTNSISIR